MKKPVFSLCSPMSCFLYSYWFENSLRAWLLANFVAVDSGIDLSYLLFYTRYTRQQSFTFRLLTSFIFQ